MGLQTTLYCKKYNFSVSHLRSTEIYRKRFIISADNLTRYIRFHRGVSVTKLGGLGCIFISVRMFYIPYASTDLCKFINFYISGLNISQ